MKTTSSVTRLFGSMLLAAGLWMSSCSSEEQRTGSELIPGTGDVERREVLLTLNNKLALHASTRGIATLAENAISTLDVYAFGSATEDGEYSFLERFAYREDTTDPLPAGATALQLAVQGTDGAMASGLLKLKRGLFVKLYCIANDTLLVDPAGDGITPVNSTYFIPLTLTEPGEEGVTITAPGAPLESSFSGYHTHLLTEAAKGDTLSTPLAMSGCLATALDLTSLDNTSRLQAGFKLTRLAARFDIVNDAKLSRFTLQSVSMGNGRRGSGYFPIRVYGDLPAAKPTELITCPVRTFYGTGANTTLCTGAFYSYPSPVADKGYLILKGLYKVNETESREVSYQIPFRQKTANGQEILLDIAANHRYTLSITEADAYHLDVAIQVADWADDGGVDYTPDNKLGDLVVTIPPGYADESLYDKDKKTVSMSVKAGSTFEVAVTTNSSLKLSRTYAGGIGNQLYNWLTVSEPEITRGLTLSTYKYTVSLTSPYLLSRYPRAILRLASAIDGSESILYVEPTSVLAPIETEQPPKAPNGESNNPNSFDVMNSTVSLYRITGSEAQVKINCLDGATVENKPDWLDIAELSHEGTVTTYALTLNDRDVKVSGDRGVVTFQNKKKPEEQKADVTVLLLAAPIIPDYDALGTGNTVTPGTETTYDKVTLLISENNKATVRARSLDGVSVKITYPAGTPEWLSFEGATPTKSAGYATRATGMEKVEAVVFTPIESKLGGAQEATVTMTNIIGGVDKVITITPKYLAPVLALSGTPVPSQNTFATDAPAASTVKLYRVADSRIQLKATALGGTRVVSPAGVTVTRNAGGSEFKTDNIYTIAWDGVTTTDGSFQIVNSSDDSQVHTVTVQLPNGAITVSETWEVPAANSGTTYLPVSTVNGCSIALHGGWSAGGNEWFTFPATLPAGSQNLGITQMDNRYTWMGPVTLRLTNNLDGTHKDVRVTPTFSAPKLSVTSGTIEHLLNHDPLIDKQFTTFTIELPPGGYAAPICDNPKVATIALNEEIFSVTVTAVGKGTTTIRVPNYSDPLNTYATYTITVDAKEFRGGVGWYYRGYYIAPTNYYVSGWNSIDANTCNQFGSTWFVPSETDWRTLTGCVGYDQGDRDLHADFYTKGVLNLSEDTSNPIYPTASYWTTTTAAGGQAYALLYSDRSFVVAPAAKNLGVSLAWVRCLSR